MLVNYLCGDIFQHNNKLVKAFNRPCNFMPFFMKTETGIRSLRSALRNGSCIFCFLSTESSLLDVFIYTWKIDITLCGHSFVYSLRNVDVTRTR